MRTVEQPADANLLTAAPPEGVDLLQWLLADQQQLSAVEEFARAHETDEVPAQAKYYRSLVPATPPAPGEQYAFEVDLDRCSGCKACVTACHTLNGLDQTETWRDVGLLLGSTEAAPVMQHVTTACHHCVEPGCLNACPVNAYEKDPLTGIVRHLDDQCFGCQYCTLACPYDVPKYHAGKGIVRKCDMCSTRLATGEAPACVQACPHEAISVRVVSKQQAQEAAESQSLLPSAPDSRITVPTTRFTSARPLPANLLPADHYHLTPQHAHLPLVVMLVFTQLSVGALGVLQLLALLPGVILANPVTPVLATVALGFLLFALAASTCHLGRPHLAFRGVLGIRHSWLSREILCFGIFAKLAIAYTAVLWLLASPDWDWLIESLALATIVAGTLGVFCSAMIYAVTRRAFWSLPRLGTLFLLTSGILGTATVGTVLAIANSFTSGQLEPLIRSSATTCCAVIIGLGSTKLLFEAWSLRRASNGPFDELQRSARLMLGPLFGCTFIRFGLGVVGAVLLPAVVWHHLSLNPDSLPAWLPIVSVLIFVALLGGELLERYLYFRAVSPTQMPGGVRT